MKGTLAFLLIAAICWWTISTLHERWQERTQKPFWSDNEIVQICKVPYYSSKECYKLPVLLSENKKIATIHFENGGSVTVVDITCYLSGNTNIPTYTFCRSFDDKGKQWDFMPTWVNY